jgi:hypothetical protein
MLQVTAEGELTRDQSGFAINQKEASEITA